jgi:hypothetical protein
MCSIVAEGCDRLSAQERCCPQASDSGGPACTPMAVRTFTLVSGEEPEIRRRVDAARGPRPYCGAAALDREDCRTWIPLDPAPLGVTLVGCGPYDVTRAGADPSSAGLGE